MYFEIVFLSLHIFVYKSSEIMIFIITSTRYSYASTNFEDNQLALDMSGISPPTTTQSSIFLVSMLVQQSAFAIDVLLDLYAFHRSTENFLYPYHTVDLKILSINFDSFFFSWFVSDWDVNDQWLTMALMGDFARSILMSPTTSGVTTSFGGMKDQRLRLGES